MKKNYPHLSSIEILKSSNLKIIIYGNWPTPSWKIASVDTHVNKQEKTIQINILGESKGGIAMQMLKPFIYEIELEVDLNTKWEIIVKGRSSDLIKII